MNVAAVAEIEPVPIEIDPRPCELCGLKIDRHEIVDYGEGPEHYCPEPNELTLDELERRAELVLQIEVAAIVRSMELNDPRDRWKHTGEPPPQMEPKKSTCHATQPFRTPQSTIDAFQYLVALGDLERLRAWLADRPADAPFLLALLEGRPSC